MGRISNEFFSDNGPCSRNIESKLNFLIDNYGELMSLFYLIDSQVKNVQKEKEEARAELIEIRKEEKKCRIKSAKGENEDPLKEQELEARKQHCKKTIRNSHTITEKGEPLETDHYTHFVINNIKYFRWLSRYDMKVRTPVAIAAKKVTSILIWPAERILLKTITISDDGAAKGILEKTWCYLHKVPENFERYIKREF